MYKYILLKNVIKRNNFNNNINDSFWCIKFDRKFDPL